MQNTVIKKPAMESRIEEEKEVNDGLAAGCSKRVVLGEVHNAPSDSELLRILECPICSEFPVPPIFNCSNGHFSCNVCKETLKICALCQSPFTDSRNYALESIIESTKFKCKYWDSGCRKISRGRDFSYHLSHCHYGPFICNESSYHKCNGTRLEPKSYFDHLISVHQIQGKRFTRKESVSLTLKQWQTDVYSPVYLETVSSLFTDGHQFLLQTKKHKSFICWWVHCLASEEQCQVFNFDLTLFQKDDPVSGCKMQWTLPVHSIRKTFQEIFDVGLCAIIPQTHLAPFLLAEEAESKWDIRVNINARTNGATKLLRNTISSLSCCLPFCIVLTVSILLMFAIQNSHQSGINDKSDSKFGNEELEDSFTGYRGFYYQN